MQISWNINAEDDQSTNVSTDDLCGEIMLEYGDMQLSDNLVYLENWFDCFVDVCEYFSEDDVYEMDLVPEPGPLIFSVSGGFLGIFYRSKSLTDIPVDSFSKAVENAGQRLIDVIKVNSPDDDLLSLGNLVEFLSARSKC